MTRKITKKIKKISIKKDEVKEATAKIEEKIVYKSPEPLDRPHILEGRTYKLKTPLSTNAIYITINDAIINSGTENETRQPFEIFLNSKGMKNFQWITALTRLISAIFRKGGDLTFILEELNSVADPNGGYLARGGKWIPSLVAEIGVIMEEHFNYIGLLEAIEMDETQVQLIEHKKKEYLENNPEEEVDEGSGYPSGAQICPKCSVKALVRMDGCMTCLSCADSKCG